MNRDVLRATLAEMRAVAPDAAVAALAGVAGTVGSYALAGLTPGFVAAPISNFLARTLPGEVLTLAIVYLGSLGQQLNLLTAIGLATAGFAVLAGAGLWAGRRIEQPLVGPVLAAVASGLVAFAITGVTLPAIAAAVGVGIVLAGAAVVPAIGRPTDAEFDAGKRQSLGAIAGAIAVGVLGVAVQRSSLGPSTESQDGASGAPIDAGASGSSGGGGEQRPLDEGADGDAGPTPTQILLSEAGEKSLPVEGMEPLVSERFYEVDIAAVNPDLDADDWTLSITGAIDEEQTIDYETLTSMEAEHRFITLRCVGEELNGHKMDNALWTGVPIATLIEDLAVDSECECVMLRAADDYFEEFPLEALRRGFLAWGMNGQRLPRGHGYPVRALIPGHWGEINVKWLEEIEFLERKVEGFWEERGWHGTGPVNTVAKLHAVNHLGDGRIQVGGHAYAGTRGVSAVHVSTDGGVHWDAATLSEPLPGEDVWRQWMFEYDSPGGTHEVVVRAVDESGEVQSPEESPSFPSGPSGWVRQEIEG